jgi:hypothetical protein
MVSSSKKRDRVTGFGKKKFRGLQIESNEFSQIPTIVTDHTDTIEMIEADNTMAISNSKASHHN